MLTGNMKLQEVNLRRPIVCIIPLLSEYDSTARILNLTLVRIIIDYIY